jgi:hypothetical protein
MAIVFMAVPFLQDVRRSRTDPGRTRSLRIELEDEVLHVVQDEFRIQEVEAVDVPDPSFGVDQEGSEDVVERPSRGVGIGFRSSVRPPDRMRPGSVREPPGPKR